MERRLLQALGLTIFFLCLLPDPMLAARLELRQTGSGASALDAMVGDRLEVSIWVDSEDETISGAAVFLSFDEEVFELVAEDRQPAVAGFQPFSPGRFLGNGEVFRNALLDSTDPAASTAGAQLDYSVVRALDRGSGPAATFVLRARTPAAASAIRIDESGFRETRFFTPDGNNHYFRFITPMSVRVRGIGIEGLPERLVLARGQVDTTTFRLDDLVFDPVYGPGDITWSVTAGAALEIQRLEPGHLLRVVAPAAQSPWERITLVATNPDGQSATAFVDVFVGAPPRLADPVAPMRLEEDTSIEVALADLVQDPDTPLDRLRWTAAAARQLGAEVIGSPPLLRLTPAPDWSGAATVTLVAADEYGFADTTVVPVTVTPRNDAPRLLVAPNILLTRGRSDSTLVLEQLLSDAEDAVADLHLTWQGDHHVAVAERQGRLVLTAPPVWVGQEVIELRVTDAEGLAATAPLTVTVVRSLAPSLRRVPSRLGLALGDYSELDLMALVEDPDDDESALSWTVSGQTQLRLELSSAGVARIHAPVDLVLPEMLRFTVTDPSGEAASFDLLVYAASPDGTPAIAPLPEISLPAGGVDASIDLDDYLFDLDHQAADMEWFLPALEGLVLRIDASTHVLTVAAADSLPSGSLTAELRVRDPDGHEAVQALSVRIAGRGTAPGPDPDPGTGPAFAALPTLTLRAGQFDQTVDLDDYVAGVDASLLSWEVRGQQHVQVFVDPGTRQVTVLAEAGWSGPEILVLRGVDPTGRVLEGLLGIQVLPALPGLDLRDLSEAAVFAGDSAVAVPAAELLVGDLDPAGLTWLASGALPLQAAYRARDAAVVITGASFAQPGVQLIDLTARDGSGSEATGRLLLRVHPVDGSYGTASQDLRLALVPNAVQPDYLDVFVLSDLGDQVPPRLRVQSGAWSDLSLESSAPGIWQGSHVLRPGAEGQVRFLALAMAPEHEALKADLAIEVGTARPAAGKRLALAGATADFGPRAFASETVVAVMPAAEAVGGELTPLGAAVRVCATRPFSGGLYHLTFDGPGLAATTMPPGAAIYRWDDESRRWAYLGGNLGPGGLTVEADRMGLFAPLGDGVGPRLIDRQDGEHVVRFAWRDDGSGIGAVAVLASGVALPAHAFAWDGTWLSVDASWVAGGELSLVVA
ncbi:MAG: hypothetical protein ABIL09_00165, partial [Gemmatimonadota bacterium]